MKNLMLSRSHALAALVVAMGGPLARADSSFTSTSWLSATALPGITVTNSSGLVSLKGNVHVVRNQSDDMRATGRLQAWMDLSYQTNGTALFCGPAYAEVGTWDATGAKFTPSGGVWVLNYSGVFNLDGSSEYNMAGYGIGGTIEGARIHITATRSNAEPATPYLGSGTIAPAPVDTKVVVDNFDDGVLKSQWVPWSSGTPYVTETSGQLSVGGVWNRQVSDPVLDHAGAYWGQSWSVPDGQTLEWCTEVLAMNQDAAVVGMGPGTANTRFYAFGLAPDNVSLYRWTATGGNTLLFTDPVAVRRTNIVLCFALSRHQAQAVVTMRVEDRADPHTVLYEKNYLDITPFLSGNNIGLVVEPNPELLASDAQAVFDNFERRTYEVPRVGIERAFRVFWPDTGRDCDLQWAPTPEGTFQPVLTSELPGMRYKTVPQQGPQQYFILR